MKRIPFFILIVFNTLFILLFYGKVISHPDHYLFSDKGDALKNYFTYSYHIKYDSSYLNFEGMNYPYGEHFLYTDCHPALANLVKLCSTGSPFFSVHSIGILNFLLILSIFLTFIICYFLLKELEINSWFSLLFSIGITLLAPQIFRLGGHLSLSYSIAIPFSWLLIIKGLKNKEKIIYPFLLFLNSLFWILIHAYLGVIIIFFIALVVAGKYMLDTNRRKETLHYLSIFSALILPVIIFYIFTTLTDTHVGRTDNPSGFFLYNAEFDDVFLPHHPPLGPWINSATGNIIRQQWEAWSYVGFSTTILFLGILILSVVKIFRRAKTALPGIFFGNQVLNISLAAAFIVLLFAMAFPFKQMPFLLDIVPVLKQFRATGRFTWPFYFAATVFTAWVLQRVYVDSHSRQKKNLILSVCLFVGIMNIIEGLPYHIEVSKSIIQSKNLFNNELLPASYQTAIKAVNPEAYQAIIALPFYYQGSESFSRPRNEETMRASIILAYHTGIPLVCANLTRTSIGESKNIVQIVSPDFYKKNILADLPDNKPFLVIRTREKITKYEEAIFRKCRLIYQNDEIMLYSLTKSDLFKNNAQSYFDKYKAIEKNLFKKDQFYVSDDSTFFYFNGFEKLKSDKPFRGMGGFQCAKKGKNTFAEFPPLTFSTGKKYEVSIWMNNASKDALNNWLRFIIEEYEESADTWESVTCFPEQSEVINGDWSLVECTFEVKNPKNRVFILTNGKDDSKGFLFADDLLIREEGVDIYKLNENSGRLFLNNHEILLPD